jgi:hypothetical protein
VTTGAVDRRRSRSTVDQNGVGGQSVGEGRRRQRELDEKVIDVRRRGEEECGERDVERRRRGHLL